MSLSSFTPKQFLCRYTLKRGVLIYATILLIEAIMCIIVLTADMISFNNCKPPNQKDKKESRRIFDIIEGIAKCLERLVKNSYAFNGTAIIYCIVLLIFQVWVIWAVKKGKASVVLLWAVVTSIWLVQLFCLFVVLLIMYLNDTSVIAWSLCAAFGLLGFCPYLFSSFCVFLIIFTVTTNLPAKRVNYGITKGLSAYGVAVGLGLWLEMKANAGDPSA